MQDFAVTVEGSERHDGEKPYTYVLKATDAEQAGATILAYHKQEQDDDDVNLVEVVLGVPPANCGYHWNDVRDEIFINDAQRTAVVEALGNDELENAQIRFMVGRFKGWETRAVQVSLGNLEKQFEDAGGRGVELADEIDAMRATLAYRKAK